MRSIILALVLIISLQSWTKADDIRDFQIEGMSIGDSALDFFSKLEIKKNERKYKLYNVIRAGISNREDPLPTHRQSPTLPDTVLPPRLPLDRDPD